MAPALSRLTVLIFSLGGIVTAHAADAVVVPAGPAQGYYVERAVPFQIYDYEPGIYLRAYWSEPWANRRYFPITGKRPKLGRDENLSAVRKLSPPAKTFYREWSTSQMADEILVPVAADPRPILPAPLPPQK
jgi:hypothetical protein